MLLKVMTVINEVIKKKQNNYSIENNQTLERRGMTKSKLNNYLLPLCIT